MGTLTAGGGTGGGYTGNEDISLALSGKNHFFQVQRHRPENEKKLEDEQAQKNIDMHNEASNAPLERWPDIARIPSEMMVMTRCHDVKHELVEGARVQVLKHNAKFGTAMKKLRDGKWKVKLDNDMGNALLRESNLRVLAHP